MTDVISNLEEQQEAFLAEVLRRGFMFPFIVVVVSQNGSVLAMRFHLDRDEPEVLAEGGGAFAYPITSFVLDGAGKTMTCLWTRGGRTWH